MTECHFVPIQEYPGLNSENQRKKFGRYHQSYPIDKGYVVGAYLKGDFDLKTKKEEEIIKGCLEFLSSKVKRKTKKCIYGNLSVMSYKFRENQDGETIIEVLLVTDENKNPHFWGEAPASRRIRR